MDSFTTFPQESYTTTLVTHKVEVYTSQFLVQGKLIGPFKRVTDLVNRRDQEYLAIDEGAIAPLSDAGGLKRVSNSQIMVGKAHAHFIAPDPSQLQSSMGPGRDYYVSKTAQSCYVFTDTYIIHGTCYLHQGTTVQNLLDSLEIFLPITQATIYWVMKPNASWQRDLVVVNKRKLELLYGVEPTRVQP